MMRVSWVLGETKEYILSMASLKNAIRGKLENNYTVPPTLAYFVTVLECIKSDHFLKLAFSCTYIHTHTNTYTHNFKTKKFQNQTVS